MDATTSQVQESPLPPGTEELKKWVKEQIDAEVSRIKAAGSMAIPLSVKNMSIVRENKKVFNRLEVETAFDFDQIIQIMVSDPVACPLKTGNSYCHVLLFKDMQKPPIILPYIYQPTKSNKLNEWIIINQAMKRTILHVNSFRKL
eukprot:TRINITY_DN4997_c0_g7_i1.p1 TRINITY_DN4997_c0_g7~~TRINITY_DN4997_c0_g7_i1.p1  ORF type:complete len:145 (-),score=35.38 TRINITY_DN4997_c0_g7_i1:76-510(-)